MRDQPKARILIADDEPLYLRTTGELLRRSGYECVCVASADEALEALRSQSFQLLLSDLNMPGNLKLELLREGRLHWPHIPLIVITGVPSMPTAIESIRLGITDYLLKPVKFDDLLSSVRRALAATESASESASDRPPSDASPPAKFPGLLGESAAMQEVLEIIERVAETDTNVLITGESGTGKEIVAQAIHRNSRRSKHRFQVIDCTAIPEALFESVLFGHVRGSFTGAVSDQPGLLSQCDLGTAFFDELGELPAASQAKLLRAIQEQTFTPVGKSTPVKIDTRFICATNRDLEAEVNAGRFRRDLYYRLGVVHIVLPPLRDRGEDVVMLAQSFLPQLKPGNSTVVGFADETLDCFRHYSWPGNIRELRNAIEHATALTRGDWITVADLPAAIRRENVAPSGPPRSAEGSREQALDSAEHAYLESLLKKHAGNISQAAQQAGLSRQGMHKLLKKHQIAAADFR